MGEDTRDWRVQFLGKRFGTFQILQTNPLPVLGAQTVTNSTGPLNPSIANWEGYRYLQFTADQSAGLTVTSPQGLAKTWTWQTTAGTVISVTLDLCSPQGWNQDSGHLPDIDDRPSRLPLDSSGQFPDEVNQSTSIDSGGFRHDAKGCFYGVFAVSNLQFTGLNEGQTMNLGSLSLIRSAQSSVTFRPKFGADQLYQMGESPLAQPMTLLTSDEKGLVDFPAALHTPGESWADTTLSLLINRINAIPGWVATAATSFPDTQWHNNSGPANWAWSGGISWDGSQWVDGGNVPVNGNVVSVFAQPLYDEVTAYPGAGDVWSGADYDPQKPEIPLNAFKIVRGCSSGRVFNWQSGLPAVGQAVTTTPASGVAQTDSLGGFQTGPPFGTGNQMITTQSVGSDSNLSEANRWQNRFKTQLSFRLQKSGEQPRILESDQGGYTLSFLSNQVLQIQASSLSSPPAQLTSSHPELGSLASARIAEDVSGCLWLATIDLSNNGRLFRSFDGGQTFAAWPTFSMTTPLCDIRSGANGTLVAIWLVPITGSSGPSNFQMKSKAAGASDFTGPVTLVDSTGADLISDGNGFGFDCAREGADRWVMTFTVNGETSPSIWTSADDCRSWSRTA